MNDFDIGQWPRRYIAPDRSWDDAEDTVWADQRYSGTPAITNDHSEVWWHHSHIDHISEDNLRTNSDLSEKVTLQELINTVEVLLCMRLIILEVFESWKSVQRDVRRKQQQQHHSQLRFQR